MPGVSNTSSTTMCFTPSTPCNLRGSVHSAFVAALAEVIKSASQLTVLTRTNETDNAVMNWTCAVSEYNAQTHAADDALKGERIKSSLGILGSAFSAVGSAAGGILGRGSSAERKASKDILSQAKKMAPEDRKSFLQENDRIVNPQNKQRSENWSLFGQFSPAGGRLIEEVGNASSCGLTADAERERAAANLSKTFGEIAVSNEKVAQEAARQTMDSQRALLQMLATMTGKLMDAMTAH
ncbi:hypothetical protein HAX39_24580 [Citrobacter freundii]|nr:hypothetical protein [Citrobacter freundii]